MSSGAFSALLEFVDVLDELAVDYAVGGSVASSVFGEPRATADIDVLVALYSRHMAPFVQRLQADFYVDESSVRDAVRLRSSFNLIHLPSMDKVDVFLTGRGILDIEQMQRRRPVTIGTDSSRTVFMTAPENIVLRKLDWYRISSGVSERQWRDVAGVIKLQGAALDRGYMEQIAAEAGLTDLLARAFAEAGR